MEATILPAITGKSLYLEGMVSVNVYVGFTDSQKINLDADHILEHGGVEFTFDGETTINMDLVAAGEYNGINEYTVLSPGIPAKDMDKPFTIRAFVTVDGETIYSEPVVYGVLDYAFNMITKPMPTTPNKIQERENLKATLAGLLNYGAAAQVYFGSRSGSTYVTPDVLMNDCLQGYVNDGYLKAEYLEMNWDDSLLTPIEEVSTEMAVHFATDAPVKSSGKSLLLNGAISVNYYTSVGEDKTAFENCTATLYQWSGKDYVALKNSGQVLSKENASYTADATPVLVNEGYGYEFQMASTQIPAKEFGDTVYVAVVVTDANGNEYSSGIEEYSPELYAANKKNDTKIELVQLVKWMTVYGERANVYFSN